MEQDVPIPDPTLSPADQAANIVTFRKILIDAAVSPADATAIIIAKIAAGNL